jgi:hypothetical protein
VCDPTENTQSKQDCHHTYRREVITLDLFPNDAKRPRDNAEKIAGDRSHWILPLRSTLLICGSVFKGDGGWSLDPLGQTSEQFGTTPIMVKAKPVAMA